MNVKEYDDYSLTFTEKVIVEFKGSNYFSDGSCTELTTIWAFNEDGLVIKIVLDSKENAARSIFSSSLLSTTSALYSAGNQLGIFDTEKYGEDYYLYYDRIRSYYCHPYGMCVKICYVYALKR